MIDVFVLSCWCRRACSVRHDCFPFSPIPPFSPRLRRAIPYPPAPAILPPPKESVLKICFLYTGQRFPRAKNCAQMQKRLQEKNSRDSFFWQKAWHVRCPAPGNPPDGVSRELKKRETGVVLTCNLFERSRRPFPSPSFSSLGLRALNSRNCQWRFETVLVVPEPPSEKSSQGKSPIPSCFSPPLAHPSCFAILYFPIRCC